MEMEQEQEDPLNEANNMESRIDYLFIISSTCLPSGVSASTSALSKSPDDK